MVYLLPSGQLNFCKIHEYSDYYQIASHQVSRFFLVYTQANVKTYILIELPIGFLVEGFHPIEWVIRLDTNLHGLKDAGLSWFEKLNEGMEDNYFVQSQVDPCVWYK